MFGIFADLLSAVITVLFPAFASYKAIRSGNPAQLTPWLMYWVVLSAILLAESWTLFIIGWFPFYSWIRLFFLSYLVLPQTQGARILFQEYVEPFFAQHEREIEELIGNTHDRAKALGLQYLYQLIDLVKEKVLGIPPQRQASAPQPTTTAGYAQALLSRFNLPSTSSSGPGAAQGLVVGGDWYSLVTSALGAVTSSSLSSAPGQQPQSQTRDIQAEQLSASGILHPERFSGMSRDEKARFYSSQRERLEVLVSALQKEESKLTPTSSNSNSDADDDEGLVYGYSRNTNPSATRLRKNASENSFDQIDAEDLRGSATPTSRHSDRHHHQHSSHRQSGAAGGGGGWTGGWFGGSSSTSTGSSRPTSSAKRTVSSETPSSGVEFASRAVDEIGRASGFSR